ncbi:MAG: aminopeptidase P family protein [Burkholderiales bacterium]|nr:aminopeptidase P family protein [Burkholderiales bacterium]
MRRGGQRHRRRALQPASAQFHRPADPSRRPGLLRPDPVVHGLQDLLLPHLHGRPATPAQIDAYKKARRWMDDAIAMLKPGVSTDAVARAFPKCTEIGFETEMAAFGQLLPRAGLGLHERPLISRLNSFKDPYELKAGMVFAVETFCPAKRRRVGGADRGGRAC